LLGRLIELRRFGIGSVLVRFDHLAAFIVNAKHGFILRYTRASATTSDKRTRAGCNEYFSTMKTFFSIILAIAVSIGGVQAGPVHTAANVANSTAKTAKNVGHSMVKGTKKAVDTVVDTLTPTR
jgi:hypothetical protein